MISHNRSAIEPFEGLRQSNPGTMVVGDANSPRFLLRAIAEGNSAGCQV
jgi:hypothetical protein